MRVRVRAVCVFARDRQIKANRYRLPSISVAAYTHAPQNLVPASAAARTSGYVYVDIRFRSREYRRRIYEKKNPFVSVFELIVEFERTRGHPGIFIEAQVRLHKFVERRDLREEGGMSRGIEQREKRVAIR